MLLLRRDPTQNMQRWYFVDVQPTLCDEWAVILGWGRIGTNYARWKILPAENLSQAEVTAQSILAAKLRKGYVRQKSQTLAG